MNHQTIWTLWLLFGAIFGTLPVGRGDQNCPVLMDEQAGRDLDDVLVLDEIFPPSTRHITPVRRISTAARAIASRRRSFGEVGGEAPRPRLISCPTAATTPRQPELLPETSTPTPRPPSLDPSGSQPTSEAEDCPESPKYNRSGKKRTLDQSSSSRKSSRRMSDPKKGSKESEDPMLKLAAMIKSLENKIQQSEVRTATKIDSKIDGLVESLTKRMDRTEAELVTLNVNLAQAQSDIEDMREMASGDRIKKLVEEAVKSNEESVGRRPRPRGQARPDLHEPPHPPAARTREERYWLARRQLRIWPVLPTADLDSGVRAFLRDKLLMSALRIDHLRFEVSLLEVRADSPAQNQVIVTFDNVRERDEVRAKASNLKGGDRATGCQLEPPDHLRGHFKAFQNLAFCLKKKTPSLKRNVKFDDEERTLVMDINMDGNWKTVRHEVAKGMLKLKSQGSDAMSRQQLRDFLNNSDLMQSDNEDVDMTDDDSNKDSSKRLSHSLTFINANARSLGPKMQSLADCFGEKFVDIAAITET